MQADLENLRQSINIAKQARAAGSHPFGALLVDNKGEILLASGNTYAQDRGVGHAEMNVVRDAARHFEPEFLEKCTLVSSIEPCAMCAGAIYWSGIGALVFGLSETRLAQLTGDNDENLTLNLSCHQVFGAGQREIVVRGPFPQLEDEIISDHRDFW